MALLLGMAMLPAGAIAMQVGLNSVSVRQAGIEEQLGRRALQSIEVERGRFDEIRELLRVLATSPALQQSRELDCRRWLGEVISEYDYITTLALTTENGAIVCSIPQAPADYRPQPNALREKARARDDFTIGYVEYGRLARQPVLAAMEPVRNSAGRRIGFVSASLGVESIRQLLDRSRGLDASRTAIVDSTGRVIAQSSVEGESAPPGLPSAAQIRNHLGPDPAFVDVRDGRGVVVPLHAPDLYAVISWPLEQPYWRVWTGYAISVAAPLLIWLLAVAAGWFAIEIFVARPLSTLEMMARGFARGEAPREHADLDNAPSEIRSLRRTLAAMAKTLRGREQRLVEALGEERALLREVHHRVKNNLQMVASLLSIQARASKDESEAWGLARAHDRVQLLAQAHQRIYASGEVREIRLDDLAAEIARQMVASRGQQAQKVFLKLDLREARANADHAVPLAFLIGEALSNALDVVGDGSVVELRLFLKQDEDGGLRFAIDSDADRRIDAPTMGARLIDAFARQLGAQIGRNPDRPFMVWAYIPPPPPET